MINLKTSVESRKSAQAIGAPGKAMKALFTNQVITASLIFLCIPMACPSFLRSTEVFRVKIKVAYLIFSLTLFFVLTLTSCANESASIQYYKLTSVKAGVNEPLLMNEKTNNQTTTNQAVLPLIILEPIQLADFLRQQGLVIQTSRHQLQLSNTHRWAEDLQSATYRVIAAYLKKQLPGYRFEKQSSRWAKQERFKLKIQLDQFQIDNNVKKTMTSGELWIFDQSGQLVVKQGFLLPKELTQDGYENAMSQLESSLFELAQLITAAVQKQTLP